MTKPLIQRIAEAKAAPQAAICRRCGRKKTAHGKLAFSCMRDQSGRVLSGVFEPDEAELFRQAAARLLTKS